MSFSILALATGMLLCSCSTFLEHDSFSRTKKMVKSEECQNVDQNQYFHFSSGYMACNARQTIVRNNSSCLLKEKVLFHCKNQISIVYPNIHSSNCRNIQFLDPISLLMKIIIRKIRKMSSYHFSYQQSVTFYSVTLQGPWLDLFKHEISLSQQPVLKILLYSTGLSTQQS